MLQAAPALSPAVEWELRGRARSPPMPVCTVNPLIISKCGKPLGDGPHLGKAGSVALYIWVSNPWCHCPPSSQGFQEVLAIFQRVTGHGCGDGCTEVHCSRRALALEELNDLSRKADISFHNFALERVLRSTEWTPTPGNSGRVVSTTSRPQQPCPAPLDSGLWLCLWSQSILQLAFQFSCCLLFFPKLLSFPENAAFS